jgi:predicted Zn finger-like uncharacterized protein
MATQTITCPNPECRTALQLAAAPVPGAKVRCPRCGTTFEPAAVAAPPAPDTLALAPEPERRCPECQAVLAPNAVLCVNCGFDLRTGKKLEGPKKEKTRRPRAARRKGEPITEADIPAILADVKKLIGVARKELWRVPYVLGLGDDPSLAVLMKDVGRPGHCVNPNCRLSLDTRGSIIKGRRAGTSKVRITVRGRSLTVELCEGCTETILEELAARDKAAQAYLDEAREDLDPLAARFPEHPGVKEALQEMRKVGLLAGEQKPRRRLCFIATAAFGSPFAAEVETLRRYRDEVLAHSTLGRLLVRVYEIVSPPLAAVLSRSARGRATVRCLLRPVAAFCRRRLKREAAFC